VVRGWLRLAIAIVCDSCSAHHDGASCLLVGTTIVIGRGCSLLAALLAPLLAAVDALLGILDDDIR
jgi:hypothetical protein